MKNRLNVSVLGCGRWASFIGWYAEKAGHSVTIWGRPGSERLEELRATRSNKYLELPTSVAFSNDIDDVIKHSDVVLISISAQALRDLAKTLANIEDVHNKYFILCMKGLEISTGKRLTEVFKEELGEDVKVGVWLGPGHVQDFVKEIPNCMVVDSENKELQKLFIESFSTNLIRFYYGSDLIGNEIGAATKNVMGIAAGMLDGAGYSSLKGALMARGTYEISRLVDAMGGNGKSIYGLSHLGDYEATLFSPHSNNRQFGESFIKGDPFEKLAEGVFTVKAIKKMSELHQVELPICNTLYKILFENSDGIESLLELFVRPLKEEI